MTQAQHLPIQKAFEKRAMSDQPVRIAKPLDLTDAEFQSVVALIAEGGEVETSHLADRLKGRTELL
jgi:hypothetical protein